MYGTDSKGWACDDETLFSLGVSYLNIDSDSTEQVNNTEPNCHRSRDSQNRDLDHRSVESEGSGQKKAQNEKGESDEELAVLSDGGDKRAARCGLPDLVQ